MFKRPHTLGYIASHLFILIVTCLGAKKPSWITLLQRKTKPRAFLLHPNGQTPRLREGCLHLPPHALPILAPFKRKRRESRNCLNLQRGPWQHRASVPAPSQRVVQGFSVQTLTGLWPSEHPGKKSGLRVTLPWSHSSLPSLAACWSLILVGLVVECFLSVSHELLSGPPARSEH